MSETAATLASRNFGVSIFLVVLAACLLATQDGFVKALVQEVPLLQLMWLRFGFSALVIVTALKATGYRNLLHTKRPGLQAMRTLSIVVTGIMMFMALKLLSLATATVILFLSPVLVALFSTLFLGEKIGPRRYMAIFLGFAGVYVIVDPSFDRLEPAMLFPLGGAVAAAIYVMTTRQLSATSETVPTLVIAPVVITLILAPVQFFVWEPLSLGQILLVLMMGICGTLGQTSLQFGLRGGSAALLSPFLYVQVAVAGMLSIFWFKDSFGFNLSLGTALIVGSGLAIWFIQNRERLATSISK